jgi:two-component system sensor histidine kinase and response regulator WspE
MRYRCDVGYIEGIAFDGGRASTMSSDGGLEDLPLIDLFRSEVETHSEVLSAALLALERSPGDTSGVGEMMRAAHSIKGAARVVGVEPAVRVAHVMEDCFVGAQKGALRLSPADIDVLLRGVDLLGRISEATRDPEVNLEHDFEGPVQSLVVELEAMLVPGGKSGGGAAAVRASTAQTPPKSGAPGSGPGRPSSGSPAPPMPVAATIAVPEILDATAAEEIRRQFLSAIERGCDPVRFDLRATKDLDVQGLALLAAVARHVARYGRPRIGLAGVSAEMETVLVVTGLGEPYAVHAGSMPEDA